MLLRIAQEVALHHAVSSIWPGQTRNLWLCHQAQAGCIKHAVRLGVVSASLPRYSKQRRLGRAKRTNKLSSNPITLTTTHQIILAARSGVTGCFVLRAIRSAQDTADQTRPDQISAGQRAARHHCNHCTHDIRFDSLITLSLSSALAEACIHWQHSRWAELSAAH